MYRVDKGFVTPQISMFRGHAILAICITQYVGTRSIRPAPVPSYSPLALCLWKACAGDEQATSSWGTAVTAINAAHEKLTAP